MYPPTRHLDKLLQPIVDCITRERTAAEELVKIELDADVMSRIDELTSKAHQGELTPDEQLEYASYSHTLVLLKILQHEASRFLEREPS